MKNRGLNHCFDIVQEAIEKQVVANTSGALVTLSTGESILLCIESCIKSNLSLVVMGQLYALYLNGARTASEDTFLNKIKGVFFQKKNFAVSNAPEIINTDSTRRYFESHLAFYLLETVTDTLSLSELRNFTNLLKRNFKKVKPETGKIDYILSSNAHPSLNKYELEYVTLIHQLSTRQFHGLPPMVCDKLCELAKSTIIATNNTIYDHALPADVYSDSIFTMGMEGRGRTLKKDNNHVKTSHKGLMRASDPLPQGDLIQSDTLSSFMRSADQATYMVESQWSQLLFARKTQIFSNGISSTTLAMLRNILHQKRLGNTYPNSTFAQYMKAFSSLMVFNSGGHSFFEIFEVFKLPQLKEVMKSAQCSKLIQKDALLESWLLGTEATAFNKALTKTLAYMNSKLNKKITLHQLRLTYPSKAIEQACKPAITQCVIAMNDVDFYHYIRFSVLKGRKSIGDISDPNERKNATETLNKKNPEGYTALMIAAQTGKLFQIKTLINAGANVTRNLRQWYPKSKIARPNGLTALELAIRSQQYDVVMYLLNRAKALTIKKHAPEQLDLRDLAPALFYACRQQDTRILIAIIAKEPKLLAKDFFLAMLETIKFENKTANSVLLQLYNQKKLSFNANQKQLLLEEVVLKGNIAMFSKITVALWHASPLEMDYKILVDKALHQGYLPMMQCLLGQQFHLKSNPHKLSQKQLDALMNSALKQSKFAIAVLLIIYGADPHKIDIFTPHLAQFVEYLKTKDPNVFLMLQTNKSKALIDTRSHDLRQHFTENGCRWYHILLEWLLDIISLLPGIHLNQSYANKKESIRALTFNIITNETPIDAISAAHLSEESKVQTKPQPQKIPYRKELFGEYTTAFFAKKTHGSTAETNASVPFIPS